MIRRNTSNETQIGSRSTREGSLTPRKNEMTKQREIEKKIAVLALNLAMAQRVDGLHPGDTVRVEIQRGVRGGAAPVEIARIKTTKGDMMNAQGEVMRKLYVAETGREV